MFQAHNGNKAYLVEYQDFNGGLVAFGRVKGKRTNLLFDLDYLTDSMNYHPVRLDNQANKHAGPQAANQNEGTKDIIDAGDSEKEDESSKDTFVLPYWSSYSSTIKRSREQRMQDDSDIPALEEHLYNSYDGIFTIIYDDEGTVADFTNLESIVNVSPIPTSRINSFHPSTLILGDPKSVLRRIKWGLKVLEPMLLLLEQNGFIEIRRMIEELLSKIKQVKQKADGIFISQDKYVAKILKKFDFVNVKTSSTPIETQKPLVKDEEASNVDVHLYRSMIGSLMYLTASRPDIMFALPTQIVHAVEQNLDRKSTTKAQYVAIFTRRDWMGMPSFMRSLIFLRAVPFIMLSLKTIESTTYTLFSPSNAIVDPQLTPSPRTSPLYFTIMILFQESSCGKSWSRIYFRSKPRKFTHLKALDQEAQEAEPTNLLSHTTEHGCKGRKFAKGKSSVQRDPLFDEIPEDTVDHMETENAQDVGRTREIVDKDKEIDENILSTKDVLSTDKEKVSTDKEKVSTDRPIVSTDESKVSTDRQIEGTDEQIKSTDEQRKGTEDHTKEGSATQATQTPTSTIFGDDETIV
ncbi:ribonuclease H-like domain-containing protein, partial [Tanacetum coccineum]